MFLCCVILRIDNDHGNLSLSMHKTVTSLAKSLYETNYGDLAKSD